MKGSRYLTHLLRLKNIEKPLANFFASGIFNLREKLGPFLWQFPPQMSYDPERFDAFFSLLPGTTKEALALARRRDARMTGRSRLAIDEDRELRHAVEIRHPSFMHADFVALLRKRGIGLVVADTAGKWPKLFHVTSDFVYVRLHGDVGLSWGSPVHAPGTRVPRLKYAYGPRVTGGNPAWDDLRPSGTRKAGTRSRRSTAAYAQRAKVGSASAGAGRR